MRLAYVCTDPGVPVFGSKGSSVHVQEVVRGLLRGGADVELFARRVGGTAPAGLESVPVHQLTPLPSGDTALREVAALASNPDTAGALAAAGPFDAVYERHALWSYAAMEYARARDLPALLEVNAPLVEEQRRYRNLAHARDAEQAASRAFAAASAILAVSQTLAATLERHPAARGRVHVVPNGVDPDRFHPDITPARPAPADVLTIGFVGTLKPWHDLVTLVEAFLRLLRAGAGLRLLIVGDGPQREVIESMLPPEARPHVEITGRVDPADVPALVASMDVAVAPYPELSDFYFSPLKLLEYLAAGRAVVGTAIGQIRDLIADGETGLLVPPGDATALAAALDRLRRDAALRERLGRAARAQAVHRDGWDAVARRILSMVEPHNAATLGKEVG